MRKGILNSSPGKASEWKHTSFTFFIAFLVSVGGILYGYDIGVISGALLFIKNSIPMSDTRVGIIVGAVLAGGLAGTFMAVPIGDRYGRRFLIMLAGLIFIAGICLILNAHTFLTLVYARLIVGIGVGIVSVAVPLYVTEIVPAKDRGKYVNIFQLLITFGILMAYFVDLCFTPTENWRAMFAVVLVPAAILFIGVLWLPETPRWLIANNDITQARHVLQRIRHSEAEIEKDIEVIQISLQNTQGGWLELISPRFWLLTLIAVCIASFNQLTGINSFLQYAPLILKNAGLSTDVHSMLASLSIGTLNFLATFVALAFIDSLGRRPLLLTGIIGVFIAEIFLGIVNYFSLNPAVVGILSLIGLLLFIVSFAIGPGMVIWVAISELFPTRIRAKGVSLCLFFHLLISAFLSTFFLSIVARLGMAQTYWLFAGFTLGYCAFAFFLLPETKTKSLEEIQFQFEQKIP